MPSVAKKLDESFFKQSTVTVAKLMLGKRLVHESNEGTTAGTIIEVEAYISGDKANHAFIGETKRNRIMFGKPGRAYIYRIYGKYYCLNVVTKGIGVGEAVLIRALMPEYGITTMIERRNTENIKHLTDGPSKLVIAMGINFELDGHDLARPPLYLQDIGTIIPPDIILTSPRIGISKAVDLPLRFSLVSPK